jgi:hypothetical protein
VTLLRSIVGWLPAREFLRPRVIVISAPTPKIWRKRSTAECWPLAASCCWQLTACDHGRHYRGKGELMGAIGELANGLVMAANGGETK